MAPGPPNLGDNRFAMLSESPRQTKRKKKDNYTPLNIFPKLPLIQKPNPKYVVMSSFDDKKPLSYYSCFSVHKSIKVISNEIENITEMRDGSLLLLLKNKLVAEKFLSAKELPGICKIKCKYHENLNSSKGTVYAPYLNNVPDSEIIEELSSQGVTSIYKFSKKDGDNYVPSGVILLTFDLYHLPTKVDISWRSVNVREYIPNPMRCKSCQKIGHTQKHCKSTPACVNCNLPPHNKEEPCSRTQCANCSSDHPSSSKECKKFIQAKEVLTIKTKNKCSMREALKLHRQQFPVISLETPSTSFSSVARQQTTAPNKNESITISNEKIKSPPESNSSNIKNITSTQNSNNKKENNIVNSLNKNKTLIPPNSSLSISNSPYHDQSSLQDELQEFNEKTLSWSESMHLDDDL